MNNIHHTLETVAAELGGLAGPRAQRWEWRLHHWRLQVPRTKGWTARPTDTEAGTLLWTLTWYQQSLQLLNKVLKKERVYESN